MKTIIVAIAVGGVLAGLGLYVNRRANQPNSAPEPSINQISTITEAASPVSEPPAVEADPPAQRPQPRVTSPIPATVTPPGHTQGTLVNHAVAQLVSSQVSFSQKRDAWNQLREADKLDEAILELERLAAGDPRIAEYPAALGQAYLKKCATLQDLREQGILAMQADKAFDTALSLDPANWEARFTKAVAMSYWPPTLNRGEEVIQQFQALVQQQETQTPQPHFAEAYAWLGDQFKKAGRQDDAITVWQRGATFFPTDEKLRTRLASQP
jgi:tetratricopeptide (TPR) repeat protein